VTEPSLFIAALAVAWCCRHVARSLAFARLLVWLEQQAQTTRIVLGAIEALLFDRRGRLRRRRHVQRDLLEDFGRYLFATAAIHDWVRENRR
jgi:hypothetical protein